MSVEYSELELRQQAEELTKEKLSLLAKNMRKERSNLTIKVTAGNTIFE